MSIRDALDRLRQSGRALTIVDGRGIVLVSVPRPGPEGAVYPPNLTVIGSKN